MLQLHTKLLLWVDTNDGLFHEEKKLDYRPFGILIRITDINKAVTCASNIFLCLSLFATTDQKSPYQHATWYLFPEAIFYSVLRRTYIFDPHVVPTLIVLIVIIVIVKIYLPFINPKMPNGVKRHTEGQADRKLNGVLIGITA